MLTYMYSILVTKFQCVYNFVWKFKTLVSVAFYCRSKRGLPPQTFIGTPLKTTLNFITFTPLIQATN